MDEIQPQKKAFKIKDEQNIGRKFGAIKTLKNAPTQNDKHVSQFIILFNKE